MIAGWLVGVPRDRNETRVAGGQEISSDCSSRFWLVEQFACRTEDEEGRVMLLTRAQREKFLRAAIVHRSCSKVGYGLEVRMVSLSEARGTTWSSHRRQEQR